MFQKILVPIDGSNESFEAAKRAYQFIKAGAKEVDFLLVIKHPFMEYLGLGPNKPQQDILEENITKLKQNIHNQLTVTLGTDVFNLTVEYGNIIEKIINVAKDGNYDLIVLGPRGLNRIERIVLGSVSKGVAGLAHCSVLIVR